MVFCLSWPEITYLFVHSDLHFFFLNKVVFSLDLSFHSIFFFFFWSTSCVVWLCRRTMIHLFIDFHVGDLNGRVVSTTKTSHIKSLGILDIL